MDKVEFNTTRLRFKIIEKYGSIKAFALAMNVTEMAIYKMLLGQTDWNRKKISQACKLLGVDTPEEMQELFFCIHS